MEEERGLHQVGVGLHQVKRGRGLHHCKEEVGGRQRKKSILIFRMVGSVFEKRVADEVVVL